MKTKQLVGAALAMMLMASCSNELPVPESGGSLFGSVPKGMVEYQFKLSGITPTTTYSTVALETAEMAIDSVTVIVAQIKPEDQSSAKIYGVFPGVRKNNIASIQMPKQLDLGKEEEDGKQVRFVMIVNRLWTSLEYDKGTNTHSITTASTYADVEALQAFWCKPSEAAKAAAELGALPVGLPMFGIADVDRPEDGDVLKISGIKLKRPFARFDVLNDTQGSLFFKKIGIARMRATASLLGGPLEESPALGTIVDYSDLPAGINEFDNDLKSTVQPGVFYLPPGAATDNVCLLLEADLDGTTMFYTLPLTNAGGAIAVQPNTRYQIIVKRTNDDFYVDFGTTQPGWGEETGPGGGGDNDYEHDFTPAPAPDPVP